MRTTPNHRRQAAAAALMLMALTGCSQGHDSKDSAPASVAEPAPVDRANPALRGPANGAGTDTLGGKVTDSESNASTQAMLVLESPDLIKTGTVSIVSKDLGKVRDDIDALLAKYGGSISDETTRNDDDGKTLTSTLVIRVRSQWFSDVMSAFKDDPRVKSSNIRSDDVHQQVIDVRSRLTNLHTSLTRLQGFLRRATDLNAMLQFEQRITDVETQIEQLTAQRDYLANQTSVSTINVDMRTPKAAPAKGKNHDPLAHAGFLSGLDNGWNALVDVLLVVATGLGAALPLGALGALVGVPLWVVLRRRRRVTATPEAAA